MRHPLTWSTPNPRALGVACKIFLVLHLGPIRGTYAVSMLQLPQCLDLHSGPTICAHPRCLRALHFAAPAFPWLSALVSSSLGMSFLKFPHSGMNVWSPLAKSSPSHPHIHNISSACAVMSHVAVSSLTPSWCCSLVSTRVVRLSSIPSRVCPLVFVLA